MKLRLSRGIKAWAISSVAWAILCYIFHPSLAVASIVGVCIGAVAMTLGLWWGL